MGIFTPNSEKRGEERKVKGKLHIYCLHYILYNWWWIVNIFDDELTTFRNKDYRFDFNAEKIK